MCLCVVGPGSGIFLLPYSYMCSSYRSGNSEKKIKGTKKLIRSCWRLKPHVSFQFGLILSVVMGMQAVWLTLRVDISFTQEDSRTKDPQRAVFLISCWPPAHTPHSQSLLWVEYPNAQPVSGLGNPGALLRDTGTATASFSKDYGELRWGEDTFVFSPKSFLYHDLFRSLSLAHHYSETPIFRNLQIRKWHQSFSSLSHKPLEDTHLPTLPKTIMTPLRLWYQDIWMRKYEESTVSPSCRLNQNLSKSLRTITVIIQIQKESQKGKEKEGAFLWTPCTLQKLFSMTLFPPVSMSWPIPP